MRKFLKQFLELFARLLVFPAVLCVLSCRLLRKSDGAFCFWSQGLSLIPGVTGVTLRRAFYRGVLSGCGEDVCISFGTTFSHSAGRLGNRAYIGLSCSLGDVTLEDDVLIASHVSIMNGCRQHGIERLDIPIREQPGDFPPVTIGTGSWLGERCLIAADVGKHCVVGAGAVVTKPVPDYAIVVGVPAKVVRYRKPRQGLTDSPQKHLQESPLEAVSG